MSDIPNYEVRKIDYRQHRHFQGSEETSLGSSQTRSELAECNVHAVLIVAITEVVDVVPDYAVFEIVHCALSCALACSREVSFLRRSACVKNAQPVCIVGPSFSKCFFKFRTKLFEWSFIWLLS